MWCFNRNVLIGLGVVALGVLALKPDAIGAALPVLVLLACPLSMVFMMRTMNRSNASDTDAKSAEPAATDPEIVGLRAELSDKPDSKLAE